MQDRTSLSINRNDTSISKSKQLDAAIPQSKISSLSSGEFVGMIADDPENKIELKTFHCSILNDHTALKKEQQLYKSVPIVRHVSNEIIQLNYLQIKQEMEELINVAMEQVMNDPNRRGTVIQKEV